MKAILLVLALLLSAPAFAGNAFLIRNYVNGMNRICVYNHLGSEHIITIPSIKLCPLSIKVS